MNLLDFKLYFLFHTSGNSTDIFFSIIKIKKMNSINSEELWVPDPEHICLIAKKSMGNFTDFVFKDLSR